MARCMSFLSTRPPEENNIPFGSQSSAAIAKSRFSHACTWRFTSAHTCALSFLMDRLGGSGKCRSIIGREFFDAFARKFVLNVKRFPGLSQVKLLICDRLAGTFVLKLFVGHWRILARPLLQDFRWHGCKVGLKEETVEQVFETANTRRQNQDVTVAFRIHPFDVLYNIHSVLTDVIEASHKRRDVGWLLCSLGCGIHCGCLLL